MATLSQHQVEILKGVLGYLQQHPGAKDTVEGIRQWWLPGVTPRPSKEELRFVLEYLVSTGWLVAIEGGRSSRIVYGPDPRLRTEFPDLKDLTAERLQ